MYNPNLFSASPVAPLYPHMASGAQISRPAIAQRRIQLIANALAVLLVSFSGNSYCQSYIDKFEELHHKKMNGSMSNEDFDERWGLNGLTGEWITSDKETDACGDYVLTTRMSVVSSREVTMTESVNYSVRAESDRDDCDYEGDISYTYKLILDPAHGFMRTLVDTSQQDKDVLGERKFGSWEFFSGKYIKLSYNGQGLMHGWNDVFERDRQ